MNFDQLSLDPRLVSATRTAGYTTPTPIQEQAIPLVLQGRDVLGLAQTGTGKTAAFMLPILNRLLATVFILVGLVAFLRANPTILPQEQPISEQRNREQSHQSQWLSVAGSQHTTLASYASR